MLYIARKPHLVGEALSPAQVSGGSCTLTCLYYCLPVAPRAGDL